MNRIELAALNGSPTAIKTLESYAPVQSISQRSKCKGTAYEDKTNYGYQGKNKRG